MDNSETCIKMCEKAKEIQKVRNHIYEEGDYCYCSECGLFIHSEGKLYDFGGIIWLPRQDQLQEIYLDMAPALRNFPQVISARLYSFANPPRRLKRPPLVILEDDDNSEEATAIRKQAREEATKVLNPLEVEYPKQFTSMEQLWLAFVMKEKYGKIWDGEDWVKHSP